MQPFRFDNTYARDLPDFYVPWKPASVAAPRLVFFNEALAAELGLDASALSGPDGAALFAGNTLPQGAEPIAQAYAGHQFGGFSPRLGDGRLVNPTGRVKHDSRRCCQVGDGVAGQWLKHPVACTDVTTKLRRRLTIARRACYAEAKVHMGVQARSELVDEGHRTYMHRCLVKPRRLRAVPLQALLDDPQKTKCRRSQKYAARCSVPPHRAA